MKMIVLLNDIKISVGIILVVLQRLQKHIALLRR